MARHEKAFSNFIKSALVAGLIGLILLVIGILSPAWVSSHGRDGWLVEEGIWYSRVCQRVIGGPYIVSTRDWILQEYGIRKQHTVYERLAWTEFQALTAGSMICGVVAVLALILSYRLQAGSSRANIQLVIGGCAALSSCLGTFVPVLKIAVVVQEASPGVAWSRFVATAGSIVQFATSVLVVFAVSQTCVRGIESKSGRVEANVNPDPEHSVPMNHVATRMDTVARSHSANSCNLGFVATGEQLSNNGSVEFGERINSSSMASDEGVSHLAATTIYSQESEIANR